MIHRGARRFAEPEIGQLWIVLSRGPYRREAAIGLPDSSLKLLGLCRGLPTWGGGDRAGGLRRAACSSSEESGGHPGFKEQL